MSAPVRRFVRLDLPVLILAAVGPLLALRYGGYHVRNGGWVFLGLAVWACVLAARGRLSAPRSVAGIATFSLLALTMWSALSMLWADASTHDAWVETVRMLGATAAFIIGGALLANARSFARFASWTGAGIAMVALATSIRIVTADAPLRSFTAGRLDWPVGYAPGLAALYLMGMLLLLGTACGAERRWRASADARGTSTLQLVVGGAALGGAGACASMAMLAQSRGTIPALVAALVVGLAIWPGRVTFALRAAAIAGALFVSRTALAASYQTQFDLRQAPFTEGANEAALLETARQATQHAASMVLVVALVLAAVGAALVALGGSAADSVEAVQERRRGSGAGGPSTLAIAGIVTLVVAVLAFGAMRSNDWVSDQWHSCTNPPERTNDPGSATSYFSTTGTGRCDYYRVALLAARDRPLLGLGAGNFRGEYVRERRTQEEPRVVHSLPLQLLAELGIIGAALGAAVLGCVLLAAVRFTRSGPSRDPVFAGAVAALAYWTVHASIDWLWQLPAVSLPALALAGGLVACVSPAQGRVRSQVAAPIAAGAILASIALVLPVTMADRALRKARDPELQRTDRPAAIQYARDAQAFDPGWAEPFITEGAIAAAAGNRKNAAAAGRRAVAAEPRSWSVQYRASGMIGFDDTADGRAAFLAARALNPQLPARVTNDEDDETDPSNPDSLQNSDG